MRLSPSQAQTIRDTVARTAPDATAVWLFGSRVDDSAHGGDIDLLLTLDTPVPEPAPLAAQVAARISRAMHGRKVDVVIMAPNLQTLPIHTIALAEGIRL